MTAFISHFGKFPFTRMPFGLKNALTVFQHLMDVVLSPCSACSAPYMDDILVFSDSWEDHLGHLRLVLGEMEKHWLTCKPSKCMWGMAHVLCASCA